MQTPRYVSWFLARVGGISDIFKAFASGVDAVRYLRHVPIHYFKTKNKKC